MTQLILSRAKIFDGVLNLTGTDEVTMCAVTSTGEKLFKMDYVIDCEEARSSGRRALSTAFKGDTSEIFISWDIVDLVLSICGMYCKNMISK